MRNLFRKTLISFVTIFICIFLVINVTGLPNSKDITKIKIYRNSKTYFSNLQNNNLEAEELGIQLKALINGDAINNDTQPTCIILFIEIIISLIYGTIVVIIWALIYIIQIILSLFGWG